MKIIKDIFMSIFKREELQRIEHDKLQRELIERATIRNNKYVSIDIEGVINCTEKEESIVLKISYDGYTWYDTRYDYKEGNNVEKVLFSFPTMRMCDHISFIKKWRMHKVFKEIWDEMDMEKKLKSLLENDKDLQELKVPCRSVTLEVDVDKSLKKHRTFFRGEFNNILERQFKTN